MVHLFHHLIIIFISYEIFISGEMWKYVSNYSLFIGGLFIMFKDSTAPSHGQCLRERESATSTYSTAELLKSSVNSASV